MVVYYFCMNKYRYRGIDKVISLTCAIKYSYRIINIKVLMIKRSLSFYHETLW